MAIIEEELSSDESDSPIAAGPNLRKDKGSNRVQDYTLRDTPLQRLIGNRQQSIDDQVIAEIIHTEGYQRVLADLLHAALLLTGNTQCDQLNLNLLERLTHVTKILVRHPCATTEVNHIIADETIILEFSNFLESSHRILQVPEVFNIRDGALTSTDSQRQAFWIAGASSILELWDTLLLGPFLTILEQDPRKQAQVAIMCAKFRTFQLAASPDISPTVPSREDMLDDPWTTRLSSDIADRILSRSAGLSHHDAPACETSEHAHGINSLPLETLKCILLEYIKPLFSSSPHPMLNPETGRKLDRQRGGDLFGDTPLDGDWKGRGVDADVSGSIGCWKVYIYCLSVLKKEDFEQIWPWLVPPMMTLLDDHETYFRHQGIIAVSYFLIQAPVSLVRRTGLGQLIHKSLTTTFSFTSNSDNASMIRDAVIVSLRLVNRLYPASTVNIMQTVAPSSFTKRSSKEDPPGLVRFNTLCEIYRLSVMNIFTYSSSNFHFMTLAFSIIPLIVEELGKGSIRYLGDTMPVLCASLGGSPASKALSVTFTAQTVEMLIAAAEAIQAFITIAAGVGRIARWRGMILSSIATLWCNIQENRQHFVVSTVDLEDSLKRTVQVLRQACPEEVDVDIAHVRALDTGLFIKLFSLPT